jgi:hypothetical protein
LSDRYNATLWAPLIARFLSPWAEGNVSATMLDMAFWRAMYVGEVGEVEPARSARWA